MMLPPPRSRMPGTTCWQSRKTPRRLTCMILSHCAGGRIEQRAEVRVGRRVVDQDIDLAEGRQGLLDEGCDRAFFSDVSGNAQRSATELLDLRRHGVDPGLLAAGDDDLRPGAGEPQGDGPADAARSARDQCHLACQVRVHGCAPFNRRSCRRMTPSWSSTRPILHANHRAEGVYPDAASRVLVIRPRRRLGELLHRAGRRVRMMAG